VVSKMRTIGRGIRLMRWPREPRENGSWIFAKAPTWFGRYLLRRRGYVTHETLFGPVMRKDVRRLNSAPVSRPAPELVRIERR